MYEDKFRSRQGRDSKPEKKGQNGRDGSSYMYKTKKRVFDIIQIGNRKDFISSAFDIFIVVTIVLNLFVTLFQTFDESSPYANVLNVLELITILIFTVEYVLRIWTADFLYPNKPYWKAVLAFVFSLYGLIDFFTFFPYYLPILFPMGAVAFRMFRVIRIFRLFRVNAQYDAFNVIINVLNDKKNQLISSICMILIFMVAASLCMYSLEHEAQPEQFANAFSGIWWSVSTLLTVGYGDIYPVTTMGKVMAIVISFLGVGMVAIPTGIISAGFVEQYTKLRMLAFHSEEHELKFVTSVIPQGHSWCRKKVKEVAFPPQIILVMIIRNGEALVPNGDTVLMENDTLVIGAKHYNGEEYINLKEIIVKQENEWVGKQIKDLDISRQELIVMIRRKNRTIIPNGLTYIKEGDAVVLYSKLKDAD